MVYVVTYDLNATGQDYKTLIKYLESEFAVRILKSVWLLKSNKTANSIFHELHALMDANDNIWISEVNSNRQGFIPPSGWAYLR
jgi:CRISPR/Cas system-associated endoribonuclease Cas2